LEQRRDIGTGAEGKVLAANPAVPGGITEIRLLPGYGARHVDSNWDVVLGNSHFVLRCGCGGEKTGRPR
jgi:hypothetical protein